MLAKIEKYIDLRTWNLTRVLRVVFGVGIAVAGIIGAEPFAITIGSLVFLQGILNVGCGAACAVSPNLYKEEEVKS